MNNGYIYNKKSIHKIMNNKISEIKRRNGDSQFVGNFLDQEIKIIIISVRISKN